MPIKRIIEERLSKEVTAIHPLSGGDINEVYRVTCRDVEYVVKQNSRFRFPAMFELEAKGLKTLSNSGVRTPEVIACFEYFDDQFLILEYVQKEVISSMFWAHFAHDLSDMHGNTNSFFGFDQDNYIGSLAQRNGQKPTWEAFFISNRLQPLIKMAFDKNLLTKKHVADFENLYNVFSELIPAEPPSLLHGDLWSGNLMCAVEQKPVFIDPAVYYGHREVDIAMTQMFGGFGSGFLVEYNERFPLEKGWEQRIPVHNLYPNLVHLVLFGSSYLRGIEHVLKSFSG